LRGAPLGGFGGGTDFRASAVGSSFGGGGGGEELRLPVTVGVEGGFASTDAAARKPAGFATRSTITDFQTCSSGT